MEGQPLEFATRIVPNDAHPVYNERFSFFAPVLSTFPSLDIAIYDGDRCGVLACVVDAAAVAAAAAVTAAAVTAAAVAAAAVTTAAVAAAVVAVRRVRVPAMAACECRAVVSLSCAVLQPSPACRDAGPREVHAPGIGACGGHTRVRVSLCACEGGRVCAL
jgi:hypothetical protein